MQSTHSPRLYGYWRSSATWRVRWAFELKELRYEYKPVNILAGENQRSEHLSRNPLGMLPVLEMAPGIFISESLAMLEWIEETHPQSHRLYPGDPAQRAQIRALCEIINSGTAPLQTPRVQKRHSDNADARAAWAAHFTREGLRGFAALREMSKLSNCKYAASDEITAADVVLVPQIYNALRFGIDVAQEFPALSKIYDAARATEACKRAAPESQIDATP